MGEPVCRCPVQVIEAKGKRELLSSTAGEGQTREATEVTLDARHKLLKDIEADLREQLELARSDLEYCAGDAGGDAGSAVDAAFDDAGDTSPGGKLTLTVGGQEVEATMSTLQADLDRVQAAAARLKASITIPGAGEATRVKKPNAADMRAQKMLDKATVDLSTIAAGLASKMGGGLEGIRIEDSSQAPAPAQVQAPPSEAEAPPAEKNPYHLPGYVSRAVQFHPNSGQPDFVWLPARAMQPPWGCDASCVWCLAA